MGATFFDITSKSYSTFTALIPLFGDTHLLNNLFAVTKGLQNAKCVLIGKDRLEIKDKNNRQAKPCKAARAPQTKSTFTAQSHQNATS